ncbi:EamA family transporter RarD [Paenarthrobacter sp. NPDC090520]|uniref:EamA family transporter RarD n=1 Tax=unclassified Paenarthrobacter TaxID=2634190 RepID=UPI0037F3521C
MPGSDSLPETDRLRTTPEAGPSGAGEKGGAAGILFGISAYGIWGLFPLYFYILQPADALEIVASRVVWSLLFCVLLVALTRSGAAFAGVFRNRAIFGQLIVAALLIGANWLIYIYAVTSNQTVEASLGYFVNPLASVLLGVAVFRESLRPLQWVAVGIGVVAVGVLAISYGKLPWIALSLAASFSLYGFVKKRVGSKVDAVSSLSVETVVLTPFAVVVLAILAANGAATLTTEGPGHFWLLALSGVVTAIPLIFFGASARRLSMVTIGLLQYITPVLQFLVAVVLFREAMTFERWIGFGIIWLALVALVVDMVRAGGRGRRLS